VLSCALASHQIVADHAEVVTGDMGKEWAASTIAHCPDAGSGRLQAFVDFYVAAPVQFHPRPIRVQCRECRMVLICQSESLGRVLEKIQQRVGRLLRLLLKDPVARVLDDHDRHVGGD
jgi:hypothetical protein